MRLTHPLKLWQLTFFASLLFSPSIAAGNWQPNTSVRRQPLELSQFPRDVVLVGELPEGLSDSGFGLAAASATTTWSDVGCSAAELRWVGRSESVPDYDTATAILFVDPAAERCFPTETDIAWTLQQPCCSTADAADGCSGTNYPPQTILINRTQYDWLEQPDPYGPAPDAERLTVDIESVLTHELGHVLDLRHDETDPLATMAPRYLRDGGLSTLAAQDRAALCERWDNGADDCVSDSECDTFGECTRVDGFDVCQEERAEPGQYCDLADLTCADTCYLSSPAAYAGYCTQMCASDTDCPDDMFCDGEIEECRLTATPKEPGCTTAPGAATTGWAWLLALLMLVRWRRFIRRRSRC